MPKLGLGLGIISPKQISTSSISNIPPTHVCIQVPAFNFKRTLIYQPEGTIYTPPSQGTPPPYDIVYLFDSPDPNQAAIMFGHWNTAGRWIWYPVGNPNLYSYKDSSQPYTVPTGSYSNIPIINVATFTDIGICPCADSVAQVLMTGWVYGDRTLSPIGYFPYGKETYQYGDEVVRYETGVWIYENSGLGEITRTYSYADYPWLATWDSPFTSSKVCPS